jgi:hypothetical protein
MQTTSSEQRAIFGVEALIAFGELIDSTATSRTNTLDPAPYMDKSSAHAVEPTLRIVTSLPERHVLPVVGS